MYTPGVNRIEDPDLILDLMRRYSFATIVSVADGAPIATHLPILVEPGDPVTLYGHIARANSHWRSLAAGSNCLAIFAGPHGYISPRWYENAPSVPTWNYVSVHASGHSEVIEDEAQALDHLEKMISTFDPTLAEGQPESIDRAYLKRLLPGIAVFKITVDHIDAKAKLSQNKPEEDRLRVKEQCLTSTEPDYQAMGHMMS